MTHFVKGEYVMRRVEVCGVPDIWYGHVLFWGNSRNGRLLIVVEGPEFTFISDPSHLEKVNGINQFSVKHSEKTSTHSE